MLCCCRGFGTKISCGIQLWLILHPNCLTRQILNVFYFVDLVCYSIFGPTKFLKKRSRIIGPNFASLGRIIVGEYDEAAEIIQSPQHRSHFLGRAKLYSDRFTEKFVLFLSDKDAGGDDTHMTLHNHLWMSSVPQAMRRLSDPAFNEYIVNTVTITKRMNKNKKRITPVVQKMVVRYMYHAFFGAPLNDDLVNTVEHLFFTSGGASSYIGGGVKPLAAPFRCFQCKRNTAITKVLKFIMKSPSMENYTPSEENTNLSRENYARLLMEIIGIAAIVGSSNLCVSILTKIPDDYPIKMDSRNEVLLAVLEVARLFAPVNNINVVLHKEKKLTINKRGYAFPPGTLVAANIGVANLDSKVFTYPETFNPHRLLLERATLSFNHVGFNPVGSGVRQCPGRNIAVKLAGDLLIESRKNEKFEENVDDSESDYRMMDRS